MTKYNWRQEPVQAENGQWVTAYDAEKEIDRLNAIICRYESLIEECIEKAHGGNTSVFRLVDFYHAEIAPGKKERHDV